MLDVRGHRLHCGVGGCFGDVIDRDGVVGEADLAREKRLVVAWIEPRQGAGDEGRIQRLGILERCDGLLGVDYDPIVLVDQFSAMEPDQPMAPGGTSRWHCRGEAGRRATGLECPAQFQEALEVLGISLKPAALTMLSRYTTNYRKGYPEREPAIGVVQ